MLDLKNKKQIKLTSFDQISFGIFQNKKYIFLNTPFIGKQYFLIPSSITCTSNDNNLILISESILTKDLQILEQFYNLFLSYKKSFESIHKQKLLLKGLGFKMNLSSDSKSLAFKLGYSHLLSLDIPTNIRVFINKNTLNIEGSNKSDVGNFANKVIFLKVPDSYKGKGFMYKYQKQVLKEVKKK